MSRSRLLLLTLFLPLAATAVAPVPASRSSVDLDAVLERLAERDVPLRSRLEDMEAYTVAATVEELDDDGKVENTDVTVTRVTHRGGKKHVEVLRATRDGKDVTKKTQREYDRKAKSGKSEDEDEDEDDMVGLDEDDDGTSVNTRTPFQRKEQRRHDFWVIREEAGGARLRLGFKPKDQKRDETGLVGEALVDPVAGTVQHIRYRLVNPSTVVRVALDSLDIRMDFQDVPRLGPVMSKLVVDTRAGFLMLKKHVRITTAFSDFVPKATMKAAAAEP